MKKTLTLAAAAVLTFTGVSGAGIATASAAPGDTLQIVRVGTDAMGADSFANRNREFVTFKNVSTVDFDVAGVVVEDNWSRNNPRPHTCNKYTITDLPGAGTNTVLHPGEYVTVYNGVRAGGDYKVGVEYRLFANSDVDCGTYGQFFNNDADTAWVSKGEVVHSKSWDWNGGYFVR